MKLLILGGTRGTGRQAVEQGLKRGHQITAVARNPAAMEGMTHPSLRVAKGDVYDLPSLLSAVDGQDAVIFAVGATFKALKITPDVFSTGTRNTIEAMKAKGIKRLVVLSSHGSNDSARHASFLLTGIMRPLFLSPYFDDHERQEEVVRPSGLDWTIVRPAVLTNGPAKGKYTIQAEGGRVPFMIGRADVADFLLTAAESDKYVGKLVSIGG